jgi:hypothetical protein
MYKIGNSIMYSLWEFIDLINSDLKNMKKYIEFIILPSGGILLTNLCHTESCYDYAFYKDGSTREDINTEMTDDCLPLEWMVDKYHLVAVWECGYLYSSYGINHFQQRVLNELEKREIVFKDEKHIGKATAYKMWETDFSKKMEKDRDAFIPIFKEHVSHVSMVDLAKMIVNIIEESHQKSIEIQSLKSKLKK